jgi:glycine/D-amino acid oxidase-like deaminating enzyme
MDGVPPLDARQLGVSLAPVTASIVADIIHNRAPALDISPYRASRF